MKKILTLLLLLNVVGMCAAAEPETFGDAIQSASDSVMVQDYPDAINSYQLALKLALTDQEKSLALLGLGIVHSVEERYAEARINFDKAAQLTDANPDLKLTYISYIGDSFLAEGNFASARAQYLRALSIKTAKPENRFGVQRSIGKSYLMEKKFSQARKAFRKLLGYESKVPDAKSSFTFMTGKSYFEEGKHKEARTFFKQTIAIDENSFVDKNPKMRLLKSSLIRTDIQNAQLSIADSYFAEKDYVKAKAEYSKTLRLEKLNTYVRGSATKQLKAIADTEASAKTGGTTTK